MSHPYMLGGSAGTICTSPLATSPFLYTMEDSPSETILAVTADPYIIFYMNANLGKLMIALHGIFITLGLYKRTSVLIQASTPYYFHNIQNTLCV